MSVLKETSVRFLKPKGVTFYLLIKNNFLQLHIHNSGSFYSFHRMFEWGSEKCKYPGLKEYKQICCSYLRSDLLFSYSCYCFYSVIPLKDTRIGALKNAALKPIQAEDNVCIIDDYH